MEKYIPIVLPLIHASISAASNYFVRPVPPVAGWESILLILAVLSSVTGTILGFVDLATKPRAIVLILAVFLVAASFFGYSNIIVQGGATKLELSLLLVFYILIFVGIFYVLTQFERLIAKFIKP